MTNVVRPLDSTGPSGRARGRQDKYCVPCAGKRRRGVADERALRWRARALSERMGADRFHPFGYCSSEGVPPLRPGPVGTSVVPVPCPRRRDHGRLCGRFRGRLPVPGRGRAVPGGVESRSEGVRPHRCIRTRPVSSSLGALPRRTAKKRGLGKPETITFLGFTQICPGLHAHFLEDPEGGCSCGAGNRDGTG